jgi:hypothetical protein
MDAIAIAPTSYRARVLEIDKARQVPSFMCGKITLNSNHWCFLWCCSMASTHYVLSESVTAVCKYSSADENQRTLARIPAGSVVHVERATAELHGMVDVIWHGTRYSLFEEDLEDRGRAIA